MKCYSKKFLQLFMKNNGMHSVIPEYGKWLLMELFSSIEQSYKAKNFLVQNHEIPEK